MASEIRAKECRVQLKVDSVRLGGSFNTIYDVSVKPDATISKKRFTGEKRSRGDLDVNGWDISFKTEKRDHLWMQVWDLIQDAELNSRPLPEISMTLTFTYRDGSRLLRSTTLSGDFVLKLDEDSIPREGYQQNSWTGFCSFNSASQA